MVKQVKTGEESGAGAKATSPVPDNLPDSLRRDIEKGLQAAESKLSQRELSFLRVPGSEAEPGSLPRSLQITLKDELSAWKEAGLQRRIKTETLGEYAEFDALVERLEKLKLLGDKFLYTAANPIDLPMLREHGTYRLGADGRPALAVFCCEYLQKGIDRFITQADDRGDPAIRYSLWDYINDNCGPQGSVVIVWHRDKLVGQGGAEFHFANPKIPQTAIAKVLVFTDLTSS